MERTPTFLAALASAAVPGLNPVSVEALPSREHDDYDVAFVQDTEHRRWVVRAPRSEAAAARMDLTVTLLQLLARRLPFAIPSPRGFVELKAGGRAMIYPYLPGHNLAFDKLPPGAGPAADLGRALAALHNIDARLFEEAGVPTYDTDAYRRRRLSELDRAAESGRVPTGLLARWEHALEDVTLWQFAPTPVHGDLAADQVLAVFEDDSNAASGRVRGVTGWEDAKVADPADDFAALVHEADQTTVETVLEAYAHARVERPDPNLLVRARLVSELSVVADLMRADARGDTDEVERISERLRALDDEVHPPEASDDYKRMSLTPVALRGRVAQPPVVLDDDEDDEEVEFEEGVPETDAAGDADAPGEADEADEAVSEADNEDDEPDAEDPDDDVLIVDEDALAADAPETADVPDDPEDDGSDVEWTPRTLRSSPTVGVRVVTVDDLGDESEDSADEPAADEPDDANRAPDVRSDELPPELR